MLVSLSSFSLSTTPTTLSLLPHAPPAVDQPLLRPPILPLHAPLHDVAVQVCLLRPIPPDLARCGSAGRLTNGPIIAEVGDIVVVSGRACDYKDDPLFVEVYNRRKGMWSACQSTPVFDDLGIYTRQR